jgi:hypothetical protein
VAKVLLRREAGEPSVDGFSGFHGDTVTRHSEPLCVSQQICG